MCVVCGKECGSLGGRARSWRCAGVLSRSVVFWDAARARYDNPGKRKARAVPMRIVERLPQGGRYLELSGGGRSAEEAHRLRPDIEIVSAENDRSLWPALRRHARDVGYTALCGSFVKADGLFDLIYLDLTGNSSRTSMKLVHAAAAMLTVDGYLVVTITPDHEKDAAVSVNRPVTVVSLLAAESGMRAAGAMVYPNGDGKRVTLVVLHRSVTGMDQKRTWTFLLDVWGLDEDTRRRGFWIAGQKDHGGYGFLFGTQSQRWRADPKNKDRIQEMDRENGRRQYVKHKVRMKLDVEYAEAHRAKVRAQKATPAGRAKASEYHRRWRDSHRDQWNAYRRDLWARKRVAAVSGTTAEAISSEKAA